MRQFTANGRCNGMRYKRMLDLSRFARFLSSLYDKLLLGFAATPARCARGALRPLNTVCSGDDPPEGFPPGAVDKNVPLRWTQRSLSAALPNVCSRWERHTPRTSLSSVHREYQPTQGINPTYKRNTPPEAAGYLRHPLRLNFTAIRILGMCCILDSWPLRF